ncbi:hypothetical protein [Nocardia sp. NRRL S-836]|uniref:hypothetical protein n=1 Tax=Nocardia sp. NRRL S-836 TaxID=1519492 RepID=UPI0006AEDE39|nr:hypothetical protein [Nocardia sp. NRRL S-836]KOV84776.1 hypothetical protein ADL03_16050 [Nocardia sp. NRRL S-836]
MMPSATEIDPIALVTITDDGKPHEVVLCMAYGGEYWACLTCEAEGMAEEIPCGWDLSTLMAYALEHGPLRWVVRDSELKMVDARDEPVPTESLFSPPTTDEIADAAQDWHDKP